MSRMESDAVAELRLELPRHPVAGALARRFLDERLAGRVHEVACADAQLIASELVNNALLHGDGAIVLEVALEPDALRLEVVDQGSGNAPAIREQPEGGVGGWGLRIVDHLARSWGAFEGTTHVWAEIALD